MAARPKSGRLRRIGRIALYGVIGFMIGSIVLVALYRVVPPPGTPLMLLRLVQGHIAASCCSNRISLLRSRKYFASQVRSFVQPVSWIWH